MALTVDRLKEIASFLHPVQVKWYEIGQELGVEIGTLEEIKAQCSDPVHCLHKVLMEWLKSVSSPTWKALANALRSRAVDEVALAEKGKKPVWQSNLVIWFQ